MNRDEAKEILLPYRHGTTDADDPLVQQALAFAKTDRELGGWLEEHCARQYGLREKFRQIPVPDGLMQQIISERAAEQRASFFMSNRVLLAIAPVLAMLLGAYIFWQTRPGEDTKLADLQSQLALVMSEGYPMDFDSASASKINDYLKQKNAPADFVLSEPLKHVTLTGCAIETWHDKKVTLVCFHTDATTSPGTSDMWLFMVDRKEVSDAPREDTVQFSRANKLALATWVDNDKLYILGRAGKAEDVKKFL